MPLRRSDLVYTKHITYTVTGTQLELQQHIAGIDQDVCGDDGNDGDGGGVFDTITPVYTIN